MVRVTVEYRGDLHCIATHGPSETVLQTDAPLDNQGRGEAFSPTDLVATALGTCMATTMAIHARRSGADLTDFRLEVTKEMSASAPRRIARLATEIWMPAGMPRDPALEQAALTCPVHQSLHPEIEAWVKFHWMEEKDDAA